jgi:hypothetical protein
LKTRDYIHKGKNMNQLEKLFLLHDARTSSLQKIASGDYYLLSPYASGMSLAHDYKNERAAAYLQQNKEEYEFYDHYKNMEAEVLYKCIIIATPLPYDVIGHIMQFVVRTNSKECPPDLDWWHSHQAHILSVNLEERDGVLRELEENGEDTIANIMSVKHDWNDWHEKNVIRAVANVRLH